MSTVDLSLAFHVCGSEAAARRIGSEVLADARVAALPVAWSDEVTVTPDIAQGGEHLLALRGTCDGTESIVAVVEARNLGYEIAGERDDIAACAGATMQAEPGIPISEVCAFVYENMRYRVRWELDDGEGPRTWHGGPLTGEQAIKEAARCARSVDSPLLTDEDRHELDELAAEILTYDPQAAYDEPEYWTDMLHVWVERVEGDAQ